MNGLEGVSFFIAAAVFAVAVEFHFVIDQRKLMFPTDLLLHLFDRVVLELDDAMTPETDQVIMMMGRYMLVEGVTAAELAFEREPAFDQELQGAVDGRVTDLGIQLLHAGPQVLDGQMLVFSEKLMDDHVPLARRLQAFSLDVFLVGRKLGVGIHN